MGLFNRNKKEAGNTTGNGSTEFDRDVSALLARPDIQCRQDVCEVEYKKAMSLLEKPTQETVQRAYDLMGKADADKVHITDVPSNGSEA